MKIALVSDTFLPQINGVAHSAEQLASSLAAHGHDVRVYAVSKGTEAIENAARRGRYSVFTFPSVPAIVYGGLRFTLPLGFSFRDLRSFAPDVIHAHTPFAAGWEARRAARRLSVPLVGTHHTFYDHYLKHIGFDFDAARRASWRYTVAFYDRCDIVTVPTHALADELLTHGLRRPLRIVPNAIDTERFRQRNEADRAEARRALGLPAHAILFLGRLSYEKSVDQVIQAFGLIHAARPDVTLLIVGDGPERANLERLTHTLGLAKWVRFTGFLRGRALESVFRSTDLFMSASKSENMPLSVLEALASSVPVAAVGSLGMSEILDEGVSSFLVAPDRPDLLAERALALLVDDRLRAQFGKAARAASRRYALDTVATQVITIYEEARRQHSAQRVP
ncbi:glycosyltransferase [Candidatus Kaiserbacteria bacterium]|nr:glycosyltransferase [Candidatus Kaiserbacteria bacterium]